MSSTISIRQKVLHLFLNNPDSGYSIKEISETLILEPEQVKRALQFFTEKEILTSELDPWSGVGRVGAKNCIYALSQEAHRKLSKTKRSKI